MIMGLNIHRNFDTEYSKSTMNDDLIHYLIMEDGTRAQIQVEAAQIADIRNFKKGKHGKKKKHWPCCFFLLLEKGKSFFRIGHTDVQYLCIHMYLLIIYIKYRIMHVLYFFVEKKA